MPEGEITQKASLVKQATEATVVEKMMEALTLYGMKIIAAVVIIVVGLWLSKRIKNCFVNNVWSTVFFIYLINYNNRF